MTATAKEGAAPSLETLAEGMKSILSGVENLQGSITSAVAPKAGEIFLGKSLGRITHKMPEPGTAEAAALLSKPFYDHDGEEIGGKKYRGMPLFCKSIRAYALGGHYTQALQTYEKAATGMGIQVAEDGGFLIPVDQRSEILTRAFVDNDLVSRCRRLTTAGNQVKIPGLDDKSRANGSRYGGVAAYWLNEGDTITASKPTFRMVQFDLHQLAVLSVATEQLVEDAGGTLDQVLNYAVGGELAFRIGDSIINGVGASQPLGILNSNATVSVAKETNQTAATISPTNIRKMWMALNASARAGAVWFYNQDCEEQLNALQQVIGTGGVPVYLPPGGLSATPYGSLMGRPTIPLEFCPTLGTRGDIIAANLQGYMIVAKTTGVQQAVSMHARFDSAQDTYRWMVRIAGKPVDDAPITPYKGSLQTSWFVTLDTRA